MSTFREKVKATETYQSLTNPVQQEFVTSRTNLKHLQDGMIIASNIGLEKWKNQCGYTDRNIRIVADLVRDFPVEPTINVEQIKVDQVLTFVQVQAIELATVKNFNEWMDFIAKITTETQLLAINPSGHHVKSFHLMDHDNYPLKVYETQAPYVRKIEYQSLSNN